MLPHTKKHSCPDCPTVNAKAHFTDWCNFVTLMTAVLINWSLYHLMQILAYVEKI